MFSTNQIDELHFCTVNAKLHIKISNHAWRHSKIAHGEALCCQHDQTELNQGPNLLTKGSIFIWSKTIMHECCYKTPGAHLLLSSIDVQWFE